MAPLPSPVEMLAAADAWRYRASTESDSEPAAWATLALAVAGNPGMAARPAAWLASIQQPHGAIGVSASQTEPRWPTSLALLAWSTLDRLSRQSNFTRQIASAVRWSLSDRGRTAPRSPQIGHDPQLTGWSWAADTHSWLEPTCMFVLGLRAAGLADHERVREGVRMIVDRLLPNGGANYGNTIVLGQPLLAHIQPTGLAMLALADEAIHDERIEKSLDYLAAAIAPTTAPASLAFAALGLAAHQRQPTETPKWIESALQQRDREPPLSEYERSLLILAAQPPDAWLPRRGSERADQIVQEASP